VCAVSIPIKVMTIYAKFMHLYIEKISSLRNLIARVKMKGRASAWKGNYRDDAGKSLGHLGSSAGAGRDTCSIIGRFINIDQTKETKSRVHDSIP